MSGASAAQVGLAERVPEDPVALERRHVACDDAPAAIARHGCHALGSNLRSSGRVVIGPPRPLGLAYSPRRLARPARAGQGELLDRAGGGRTSPADPSPAHGANRGRPAGRAPGRGIDRIQAHRWLLYGAGQPLMELEVRAVPGSPRQVSGFASPRGTTFATHRRGGRRPAAGGPPRIRAAPGAVAMVTQSSRSPGAVISRGLVTASRIAMDTSTRMGWDNNS
jgi:hypothetical protein